MSAPLVPVVRERSRTFDAVVVGSAVAMWFALYTAAVWSGLRMVVQRVVFPRK
jgi:hypothetical protein